MDRQYRRMFDQALEQAGPEPARVDALRRSLARRCSNQAEQEVIPMKKRTKFLRGALIAAVVAAMLTATAAAVALGQRQQAVTLLAAMDGDNEHGRGWVSENTGVYLLDGRYYFKLTQDSEPIDITGQFSDTVPYVYTRKMPADGSCNWDTSADYMDYVIGRVGDGLYCVMVARSADGTSNGSLTTQGKGAPSVDSSPFWWRAYCHDRGLEDSWHNRLGGCILEEGWTDVCFVLDSLSVDSQTGAVTVSVNGGQQDITGKLDGGKTCVLSVAGPERTTVYIDESLRPTPGGWAESWDGDYDDPNFVQYYAEMRAYEDSRVLVPNAHEIVVRRDGDQVRYAEFIYRPDGTLWYWLPFNCPSSAELGWLEEYAAQRGYELDWLMDHAYEQPTEALKNQELQDWPDWLGSYSIQDIGTSD